MTRRQRIADALLAVPLGLLALLFFTTHDRRCRAVDPAATHNGRCVLDRNHGSVHGRRSTGGFDVVWFG